MAAFSAKSAGGSVSHSVRVPPFAATVGPRVSRLYEDSRLREQRTLDPIRCTLCVKSSLDPGGIQRTKSTLSPERVYR